MMFADISRPLPMEGEELFDDGKPIRFGAGLRQIVPGDLVVIEWPVDQSFGTGNWVKGGITKIEMQQVSPKARAMPVLGSVIHLNSGWFMGSFRPEVSAHDSEGMCELVMVPNVKVSNIPWHWELRTDDVPGWNLFVVGHHCALHNEYALDCTTGRDRRRRANEARAKREQKR